MKADQGVLGSLLDKFGASDSNADGVKTAADGNVGNQGNQNQGNQNQGGNNGKVGSMQVGSLTVSSLTITGDLNVNKIIENG
jgi:hypothetical protein